MRPVPLFRDRADAGRRLADRLTEYAGRDDVIVLALPRGGVPIGYEVACAIDAPLDVFLVRKLGVPGREELAMGAIASGGVRVLNDDVVAQLRIPQNCVESVTAEELDELRRREIAYRLDRPSHDVRVKTVILVDDGLATGASMRAAIAALRMLRPARIVVAVPVGATQTCDEIRAVADKVICTATPDPFYAIGTWYADFEQTTDQEVRDLLAWAGW